MMHSRVEPIKNGSTPISTKRLIVDTAELVCKVENTIWPVNEAFMAMPAVSASRISPTIITSGSWRKNERSALAKVTLAPTCTCEIPCITYSIGSSAVITLISLLTISPSAEYKVVDLPEPVGPVIKIIPWGFLIATLNLASETGEKPILFSDSESLSVPNSRNVARSPNLIGIVAARISKLIL